MAEEHAPRQESSGQEEKDEFTSPGPLTNFQKMKYEVAKFIVCFLAVVLYRLKHFGRENIPLEGGFVLVANHQCFFDPFFVGSGVSQPVHFMTRASAFKIPLIGTIMRQFTAFPVERGQADIRAIRRSVRLLEVGEPVLIFPEGTRTSDGEISKMKSGAISIAQRAGCPIVPAAVRGAYEAWPRHQKIPGFGKVSVAYAPAIQPGEGKDDAAAVAQKVELAVRNLYDSLEHRHA